MKDNSKKRKLNRFAKKYITADAIKLILMICILVFVLYRKSRYHDFAWTDVLDFTIVVSFLLVFIADALAKFIWTLVGRKTEDGVKLRMDSEYLVKKYSVDKPNMVRVKQNEEMDKVVIYPEIVLAKRDLNSAAFTYDIQYDEERNYTLPGQVAKHSKEIFDAHRFSTIYNNRNIRLSDFEYDDKTNHVKLVYSFTTYFDSLMTNRAMDFPFDGDRSIREIYEPGPMISSLKDSRLSNHLGFNGFVELADGKIVFILRGNTVSIGKGTWSQSVGASLKAAYALNEKHEFTLHGLSEAIRGEIKDELKIEVDEDDLTSTIFAFYRELVEGGKPQFLFYYKTYRYDSKSFEAHFREVMRDKEVKKENKKKQVVDGTKFMYLSWDDLRSATFETDALVLANGTRLNMVPSSLASVAMLVEFFDNKLKD